MVNGKYSSWLPVQSGVPQGSIFGPLLFILYVNDIYFIIHYSKHGVFADDLCIYKEVSTTASCNKTLIVLFVGPGNAVNVRH